MSRLYNESKQDPIEQQYNRAQYDAFANQNYEKMTQNGTLPNLKFDPSSLEDKMKKFRFVNPNQSGTKDNDWFSKLNSLTNKNNEKENGSQKKLQLGITKEDEK